LRELREFASKQGWNIYREYVDHASGSRSDRSQFQEPFSDASKRKFDLLLFWSLDRWSREGMLATLQRLQRLTGYGVGYRSFTEPYLDSCGIFKDAIIGIMATLAKQERIRISERTRAGLATARLRGKRLGRPPVNVNLADVARLRSEGKTLQEIADEKQVSTSSVFNILKRQGQPVA
jgi:DNA invertase Pin-like site-specific DNA recombinase